MSELILHTKIVPPSMITQELEIHDPVLEQRKYLARWLVNVQDQKVREALIKLGWTPPEEEEE
jgi:hypothetical protein